MPGAGYYTGLLQGMQGMQQIDASQMSEAATGLNMALKLREVQKQIQEDSLLKSAFAANAPFSTDAEQVSADAGLYEKLSTAGQKLMGIDPALGLRFLQQAENVQTKQQTTLLHNMQMRKVQAENVGDIFSTINDQDSLDNAVPELAKQGVIIPAVYRTWSPETKAWIDNKSQLSPRVIDAMKVNIDLQRLQLQKQDHDIKERAEERKQRRADLYEKQLQANLSLRETGKFIEPNSKLTEDEMTQLSGEDVYGDLEVPDQMRAAKDVYRHAYDLRKANPKLGAQEAMAQAEAHVLSRISDGKYLGLSNISPTKQAPQAALDYLKAHPETADKFKETFGYLP